MRKFTKQYIENLTAILEKIDTDIVTQISKLIDSTKGRIYIIGNGGSAATASHMVNDLGTGLKRRGIKNFDVESLSDNTSVCTALANDIGYENIFYMQLKDKIKKDDVLIAISCSGNSPNIIKAVKYAKKEKVNVIGLTGFDGGKLRKKSDISFHVQTASGQYGIVEDVHMILNHMLYGYYTDKVK